jgi:acetate kinase
MTINPKKPRDQKEDDMNVLVFNPGSSSLKFEVIASGPPRGQVVRGRTLLRGVVEPIGGHSKLVLFDGQTAVPQEELSVRDHGQAAKRVLNCMEAGKFSAQGIATTRDVQIAGYRVVHGGQRYREPVRIDDDVIKTIEEQEILAPLHNAGASAVIRASRSKLGEGIPAVAVFDTGFHSTLPDRASIYAIPWELTRRYGIRRFGFHGISHNYLLLRYAELTETPVERTNIISLHLEGGSSATAVVGGKSIDTSMGFTPLEGLVMGTRSGDVDPALVAFLAQQEKVDASVVEDWLNKKSGLLGVSGRSQDTRVLVPHASEDERTELALDIFAYRVRKYIGAYLAATGGVAAVVFGGGIGENTPDVRRRICEGLEWLGLDFDPERNAATVDREGQITRNGSRLHAYVIPTKEALMIAHEALRCCGRTSSIARRPDIA